MEPDTLLVSNGCTGVIYEQMKKKVWIFTSLRFRSKLKNGIDVDLFTDIRWIQLGAIYNLIKNGV